MQQPRLEVTFWQKWEDSSQLFISIRRVSLIDLEAQLPLNSLLNTELNLGIGAS